MTKKCDCPKPTVDITIIVPDSFNIGTVEVIAVPKQKPKKVVWVDKSYDSDEDEDYEPSSEEESEEDLYDSLPFTEAEKQELRDELAGLIADQENDV